MITQISMENNGTFSISKLMELKEHFKEMPNEIITYNNNKNKIIMDTTTDIMITYRQKHPIKKKIANKTINEMKIISALNKLTMENLTIIVNEIVSIDGIMTDNGIMELADNIIKKIGTDKQFTQLYVKLCMKLIRLKSKQHNQYSLIILVSNKCKNIFDSYIENKNNALINDIEEQLDKTKIINYIKFIGELYTNDILKIASIKYCIDQLMNKYVHDIKSQYCIEIIITLMKIIIDKYTIDNKNEITMYCDKLNKMCDKCKTFRDKFLIQDFIEK